VVIAMGRRSLKNFSTHIYRVLKQVHPDTGISAKAMQICNDFVYDILVRIESRAAELARVNDKHTITSREIQSAVRMELPGELAKHAVSEGTKAVTKYNAAQYDSSGGGGWGGPKGGRGAKPAPPKRKNGSKSSRAGLTFPVPRVHRILKHLWKQPVGAGAPVYLAAVLEYLTAELLELSGNAARDNRKVRIIPRHLMLALRNDEELNKMAKDVHIAGGGVIPNIHSYLIHTGKKEMDDFGHYHGGPAKHVTFNPGQGQPFGFAFGGGGGGGGAFGGGGGGFY